MLNKEYTIIIDDNNLLEDVRFKFFKLCRKYYLSYCVLLMDTDIKTCLQRCKKREK